MNPIAKQQIWDAVLEGVKGGHVDHPYEVAESLCEAYEYLFDYQSDESAKSEEENVKTVRLMPTEERILGLLKTINDEIDRDARTCFCKGRDSWIKVHREDYNALASALDSDKRVEWIMRIYDVPQSEDSLEEASKSSS